MVSLTQHHLASSSQESGKRAGLLPGIGLCLAVTGAAYVLETGERTLAGKA